MARYIDADKLLEELKEEIDFESPMYTEEQLKYFTIGLRCAYRDVVKIPSADVVPRSEVEKIFEELKKAGIDKYRYPIIAELKKKYIGEEK